MMEERRELKLRGSRVSTLHSIPLGAPELSQLLSSPSTIDNSGGTSIVSISSTGHATIIPAFTTTTTQDDDHKSKCQQAVNKLQSQRQHCRRLVKRGKRSHCRDYAEGMVMMTLRDRQFLNDEAPMTTRRRSGWTTTVVVVRKGILVHCWVHNILEDLVEEEKEWGW
jgi:hypothetical protein